MPANAVARDGACPSPRNPRRLQDSSGRSAAGRRGAGLRRLAGALALLWAAGCDDGFSPIAPTELRYSVFGYLDASADTQWIRVMPIRPLVPTAPDSFGTTVTLEQLGTGRLTTLRDSLFTYRLNPDVESEGAYLHNFWTTERIAAGAAYRLSVKQPGEETADATVAIPNDFCGEVWISADGRDSLRVAGIRNLPFVAATSSFWDLCGSTSARVSFTAPPAYVDSHTIAVRKTTVQARSGCGQLVLEKRELWLAGAAGEWPSVGETWGIAVPDRPSNISHSVGFVGGVLTKTVPYENCEFTGPTPLPRLCKLSYGGNSATLTGTVQEVRCGKGPIDSVRVQRTELNPNPTHRKVRTTLTNRSGEFTIGALEPGIRYILKGRSPTRPNPPFGPIDMYASPTDTIQFTPGERAQRVVGFRQNSECWMDPT
ncbi:MAG: hypothetical protein FIB01_05285 [Gemmatimonadetes bacterium]|nr:hypothetical protein [Gemmatimonadota bacterium]